VKYFFFDAMDRRNVERGIGGTYIADTTAVSMTLDPSARATFKEYTFTTKLANKARVRVYANIGGAYEVYVNVNGVDAVKVVSTTATGGEVLVVDAYVDIPQNATVTIKVDVRNPLSTTTLNASVTKCYIIAGYALTSTTTVDILTVTLDPNNDVYKLDVRGNFTFKVGVRWWVKGNRKTTATASITSTLSNEVHGVSNLDAGDDGDSEVFLRIGTGDYATSFTIKGNVGADGDIIIVTSVYCQIVLRSIYYGYVLHISEAGVMFLSARALSITGDNVNLALLIGSLAGSVWLGGSSSGTDVRWTVSMPVWNLRECMLGAGAYNDATGTGYIQLINLVIIGE
jgi:hypothetical protein